MQPVATDVTRSVVCVSVCVRVGHNEVLCTNGWTGRYGSRLMWAKGTIYEMGVEIFIGRVFYGVVRPIKMHWECAVVCATKGIIQSSITAAREPTAVLSFGWYHSTFSEWKIRPPVMRPIDTILWLLVICTTAFPWRLNTLLIIFIHRKKL